MSRVVRLLSVLLATSLALCAFPPSTPSAQQWLDDSWQNRRVADSPRVDQLVAGAPAVQDQARAMSPQQGTLRVGKETEAPSALVTTAMKAAVLELSILDCPDPVFASESLTYTLIYSNTGDLDATNIVISDVLDGGVTFDSASPEPSGHTAHTWYWVIPNLAPLDAGQVEIRVDVHSGLAHGSVLTNAALMGSAEAAEVTTTETSTVITQDSVVSVTLTPAATTVTAGQPVTYALTAHDEYGLAWDVTSLASLTTDDAAGGSWAGPVYTTEVSGTWVVTGAFLGMSDTALLTVLAPDLHFAKTDERSTVHAGDLVTYTLLVTNSGGLAAQSVIITDTFPSIAQYSSCHIDGGTCSQVPDSSVRFTIPVLAAQSVMLAQLMVRVSDPLPAGAYTLTNQAILASSSISGTLSAADVDMTATRPDLTISVAFAPTLFAPGKLMTYTITYGNVGRMAATQVAVTTTLPLDASYAGQGWTPSDGRTYTLAVGEIPAGATGQKATFTVRYPMFDPQAIAALEFNTPFAIAETTEGTADANPSNNVSWAYVGVPDLVIESFSVEPLPLRPNRPVTFTLLVRNQGTGPAWNPDNTGGFFVDVFIAPVPSYPFERYSERDIYAGVPPIASGAARTVTIVHAAGFSALEIAGGIQGFYAKIDNHDLRPYGLVPEHEEMNNVSNPLGTGWMSVFLPLVRR